MRKASPERRPRRLEDSPSRLRNLTTAILAGGRGTRLQPILGDRPKVLAQVHGRPFLAYILDHLAAAGIEEVLLLTGYQAQEVRQAIGPRRGQLKVTTSPEPAPLGTGGALRHALTRLQPEILLLNGDSWCDADLLDFHKFHHLTGAELSVLLVETTDATRFGKVTAAPDGRVLRFQEKKAGQAGWINAGIYLLNRALAAEIPPQKCISLERDLIPQWIAGGRKLFGYRHAGRFLDIGTPSSYAAAAEFLSAACGLAPTAGISTPSRNPETA